MKSKSLPSRSLLGERGLKLVYPGQRGRNLASLPTWGAWIEITTELRLLVELSSLPTWGAWIEILLYDAIDTLDMVAPYLGSVD